MSEYGRSSFAGIECPCKNCDERYPCCQDKCPKLKKHKKKVSKVKKDCLKVKERYY
ncbi:MAG: hypothetical protein ACI35S_00615 [Anaeroplasma sp.]